MFITKKTYDALTSRVEKLEKILGLAEDKRSWYDRAVDSLWGSRPESPIIETIKKGHQMLLDYLGLDLKVTDPQLPKYVKRKKVTASKQ